MAVVLGTDGYRYEVDDGWAKLPPGYGVQRRCRRGRRRQARQCLCLQPRQAPDVRLRPRRQSPAHLGRGRVYPRAHGVFMAPDDTIWLTDDGDHTVRQCTLDGKVLLTIGIPGKPAPYMSGEPFHRCTHTALSPQRRLPLHLGRLRQCPRPQIHRRRQMADAPGASPAPIPASSTSPHNICCDPDGWVYVADRENHRVQVFDGNGKYETQWNNMHRPSGLYMETGTGRRASISARSAPTWRSTSMCRIAGRGSASTPTRASSWRGSATRMPGSTPASSSRRTASPSIRAATSMSAKSRFTNWGRRVRAKGEEIPPGLRSLQKLVKVG